MYVTVTCRSIGVCPLDIVLLSVMALVVALLARWLVL